MVAKAIYPKQIPQSPLKLNLKCAMQLQPLNERAVHAFAMKMAAKHSQCTTVESSVSLSITRYRRKFRSIRRWERKGFFGNRRQNGGTESFEVNEEESQVLAVVIDQPSNTNERCSQSADNLSNDSSAVNVLFEKVMNSSFEKPSMSVPRSQTAQFGFCTKVI